MALGIVIFFTVGVLIWFCRHLHDNTSDVLINKDCSSALKGFAILLVFIHHFGQLSSPSYYYHGHLGYIGVTIFLFVAGYVSQKQLALQGNKYVDWHFFGKKFCRLYLPYLTIVLAFSLVYRHPPMELALKIIHIEKDWFLTAITIYYVLFWLSAKAAKIRGGTVMFMAVATTLYSMVCLRLGIGAVWYNTAFAFPLGMVGYELERKNRKICTPFIVWGIPCVTVLLIILSSINRFPYALTSVAASVGLAISLLIMLERKMVECTFFGWFGGLSWEIYLCQSKILSKIAGWFSDLPVVCFWGSLIGSLCVAYVVRGFLNGARHIIGRCTPN